MSEIRRILCPVDFSDYSGAALEIAGELARMFGARVRVVHAQRIEVPVYFTVAQTKILKEQLRRSDRAAQKYTEKFATKHLAPAMIDAVKVVEGDAVEIILRSAEESNADLLVMGTHGRTGLSRIKLGSVAESVLRQTSRPVLTVGPRAVESAKRGAIRKVLCAVDYSEVSRHVAEYAAAITERAKAELIVGHVQESERSSEKQEGARQKLCDWIPEKLRERCSVEEVIREGRPAEQIVIEAEKSKADLLVVGARPRHDLGSLLFGSTTEAVIRSAPCPVVSIIEDRKP